MITDQFLKNILTYDSSTGFIFKSNKLIGYKNKKGYVCIYIKGREYKAHRLAWLLYYGHMPAGEIDHIDGDRENNRIENLRDCDRIINMCNLYCHRKGSPVGIKKRHNKYAAYVTRNRKQYYIGIFDTIKEAVENRSEYILANF